MADHDWKSVGNVSLMNCHGCYLSWAPGGDCRANERRLDNEEIWQLFVKRKNGQVTFMFGKPVGAGLFQFMSIGGPEKRVNCKSSCASATEWIPMYHNGKWAFHICWW